MKTPPTASDIQPAEDPGANRSDTRPAADGAGQKIFVVDDHTDASNTLALALQCLGYEAHSCYSGPQAIARARALKTPSRAARPEHARHGWL